MYAKKILFSSDKYDQIKHIKNLINSYTFIKECSVSKALYCFIKEPIDLRENHISQVKC
jgi:hypothetical protein